LGLWLFDLAVLQMQQEAVPTHELGEFTMTASFVASCMQICEAPAAVTTSAAYTATSTA